jgi:molybdopterin converting factor small subunit
VGGERQVEAYGGNVREVLEDLARRYPALEPQLFEDGELASFVNVYLGGEDIRTLDGLETTVDGLPLILLPAMAGGAPGAPAAIGSRRDLRSSAPRRESGRTRC